MRANTEITSIFFYTSCEMAFHIQNQVIELVEPSVVLVKLSLATITNISSSNTKMSNVHRVTGSGAKVLRYKSLDDDDNRHDKEIKIVSTHVFVRVLVWI